MSITVVIFCVVIIGNLIFVDTAYTSEDFYYIGYFAVGFFVLSKLTLNQIIQLYKLLVYLFIFLSFWALIQYYTGNYYIVNAGLRSNIIFTTPNTFAAAINLILFPLITINLGPKNKLAFIAMLFLFYALLVTQSRGGFLSFMLGLGVILFFSYRNKKLIKFSYAKVFTGLISILIIFLMSHLFDWQEGRRTKEFDLIEISRLEDISNHAGHRLVLYDAAWQRIKDKPLLGYGYHNFQFFWLKDQKPPFKNSKTKFVHNDYLQLWMETGFIGFISILSIIAIFYIQIWFSFKQVENSSIPILLGLAGGMSAYFAHAMVDFVFYPCFLALLFGAYLATTNRVVSVTNSEPAFVVRLKQNISKIGWDVKFWQRFISLLLILFFSQPYIAELCFKNAEKNMKQLKVEKAIPYYELARRFVPYNEYYYALEGTYWRTAVMHVNDGSLSAERADQLFAKGAAANPFDVTNILSRAVLNRDYPQLLSKPANNDTILKWFEHILYWQPKLVAGQLEYVKTLYRFGQEKKAKDVLAEYIIMNPGAEELLNLKEELLL